MLAPEAIQGRVEGDYPNSRVLLKHRLPDVIDDVGDRHELWLVSSVPQPLRLSDPRWDPEAVQEVKRRLGRSAEGGNLTGGQKGRVLYLVAGGTPVAFLTYHVPASGEIEIRGADSLFAEGGYHQIEVLLTAARKVALLFGADRDHLFWHTDRPHFDQVARRQGFDDRIPKLKGSGAAAFQLDARF